MPALLEICVDDPAGLAAAVAGGADRIELCSALELGGLTPSAAAIASAVECGRPVHVMIRPRAGDFSYDADEIALMRAEIVRAAGAGAAGIVVGALGPDRRLDADALARLRDMAAGMAAVLHRAIDLTPDPVAAVGTARELGFDAVLSSGGAIRAPEGIGTLRDMVAASGTLTVIAGAGITPDNVAPLIAATGVDAVHGSASVVGDPPDATLIRFGFAQGALRRTSAAVVRRMRAAIDGAGE